MKYLFIIAWLVLFMSGIPCTYAGPSSRDVAASPAPQPSSTELKSTDTPQETQGAAQASPQKQPAKSLSEIDLYRTRGHRSPAWDDLIQPGFLAFDGENYPTASVFFQKAYDRGCRDGLVLYKLGFIYEIRGNFTKAAEIMEQAIPDLKKRYPNRAVTRDIDAHLGRMYYQIDRYDKALPLLDSALAKDPKNFMLLFLSGQILRQQKKFADAYKRYTIALNVAPPPGITPDPRLALIKELMMTSYELGYHDEALKYADALLTANPRNQLAQAYKERIQRSRMQQEQDAGIQKIIDQYK